MIRKNKSINPLVALLEFKNLTFFCIFFDILALFGSFWLFLALFLDFLGIFTTTNNKNSIHPKT